MRSFSKHWQRIAITLIPLIFALLHASGALRIGVMQRLDDIIYDARLRATMPKTMDERIVIVDDFPRTPFGKILKRDLRLRIPKTSEATERGR